MNTEEAVIYLASCAVNGIVPDKDIIDNMNLAQMYSFASFHMLGAIVSMSLENAKHKDDVSQNFIARAVRKAALFDVDMKRVLEALEQAAIWYMPLKGSVLKDYYPRFGMREMSDRDVLIDISRARDVKRIMESLGFLTQEFGYGGHDIYYHKPVCNFEMHRELFESSFNERLHDYYVDVKGLLIKDEGNNYGYHFSLEDFYVYMTAHEYKHYHMGGVGLRSLLDTYVFMNKFGETLDLDYVIQEAEKLGIAEFEEKSRSLALNLFDMKTLTDDNREMLEYMLHSGAYGTFENSVNNMLADCGEGYLGRVKYVVMKIFPDPRKLKGRYPLLCRHKILYPLLVVYRLLKAVSVKRREVLREIMILFKSKVNKRK